MATPYTPPQLNSSSFNCPHCKAFSSMSWDDSYIGYKGQSRITSLRSAYCTHCNEYSLWIDQSIIYPSDIDVESPNSDLPEEIQVDYLEAASILNQSSRGATALLRLTIEKLVNSLDIGFVSGRPFWRPWLRGSVLTTISEIQRWRGC